jgi:hypothetical protein
LPSSSKRGAQNHIPALIQVLAGSLDLFDANLVHRNVGCALQAKIDVPVGLAMTQ